MRTAMHLHTGPTNRRQPPLTSDNCCHANIEARPQGYLEDAGLIIFVGNHHLNITPNSHG